MLTTVLLLARSAVAATSCASTPAMMTGMAHVAEQEYVDMKDDDFKASMEALRKDIGCLIEAPTPSDVAQVHRVEALAAFQAGDRSRALASLRAMVEADSTATLSEDVAPPGHALQGLLAQARAAPPSPRTLGRVFDPCQLVVDGRVTFDLPKERPSLTLIKDPRGHVLWAGLLPPDPLVLTVCPISSGDASSPTPPRRTWNRKLNLMAGSTALVAAGLWAWTAHDLSQINAAKQYIGDGYGPERADFDADEVEAQRLRVGGIGLAAQTVSGVALGFGVAAIGARFVW